MGNRTPQEPKGLVARLVGTLAPQGKLGVAISQARMAVSTKEWLPEDEGQVEGYSDGLRSRAGHGACNIQELLFSRAFFVAAARMEQDVQKGLCPADAYLVDFIIGEHAIKDGEYAACKNALYEVLLESVRRRDEAKNADYVQVVYLPVPEGSRVANLMMMMFERASEALPKSRPDITLPKFELRFVGIPDGAAAQP